MNDRIKGYLDELENEKSIRILLACETGSRAWGFPSPDSDYDVRIIYMHHRDWYLSLKEGKDTIELMRDDRQVDISGWDLRKCLRLLWKSNPPLLERLQSPIVYASDEGFMTGIHDLAQTAYSRIATIHHYLSMAKSIFEELEKTETYKLKKLFYALRTAVACKWILDRNSPPPIVFQHMLDTLDIDKALSQRIRELIILKATVSESYLHSAEESLHALIRECIVRSELQAAALPPSIADMKQFNTFFTTTLDHYER